MISAGIIPFRYNGDKIEFFLSHPTNGGKYWAFCKGGVEEGESWAEAAFREFNEETGLNLSEKYIEELIPLGSVQQSKKKTVIAFGLYYPNIDPKKCYSNLCEDNVTPENDSYAWMTLDELVKVTHHTHLIFYNRCTENPIGF